MGWHLVTMVFPQFRISSRNRNMRWLFILTACIFPVVALAQEQPSIRVTAKSEVKVPPDEVLLFLVVDTRSDTLLEAKDENDQITAAVLTATADHSVDEADVQVTDIEVSPYYGESGRRFGTPLAHGFLRSIQVRMTDFAELEPLLSDAFAAGLTRIDGLQFRVSNQRAHQFEARALAVTYAKEKASHLAELTGVKLGLPTHIEEDVEDNWRAGGFGGTGGMGASIVRRPRTRVAGGQVLPGFVALQMDKADVLTAPGEITISANVTIVYAIAK